MALRNLITDIPGLRVGHAGDAKLGSGVDRGRVRRAPWWRASTCAAAGPARARPRCSIRRRRWKASTPSCSSGGSAFGLDAASGVQACLREQGRGFQVREARVPIVPGAILFDLLYGGDKNWGRYPPYRELGYEAAKAAGADFALGSAGAGLGATTVNLKGGIGSASAMTRDGLTVGALVAANAAGSVTIGDGPHFWAAPFEQDNEFGGRGWPAAVCRRRLGVPQQGRARREHDAGRGRDRRQADQGAMQTPRRDGADADCRARSIRCTPRSTATSCSPPPWAQKPLPDPVFSLSELGMLAANVLARAIARGVYEATALPFPGALPSWNDRFDK